MSIYEEISLFAKRQRDEINKEKKKRRRQVCVDPDSIIGKEIMYAMEKEDSKEKAGGEEMQKAAEFFKINEKGLNFLMKVSDLAKMDNVSTRTICRRAEEIEKLIPDRYPEGSVIYTGNRRSEMDLYVYQDYKRQRGKLMNPLARKYVKPYSADEMALICPVIERVVVMTEG